jgi:hypothetical protein
MENLEYRNKEIEAFLESEYVNIQEGESRVLEFVKKQGESRKETRFQWKSDRKSTVHSNRSRRPTTNRKIL